MITLLIGLAAIAVLIWLVLHRKAADLPAGKLVYSDTDRHKINAPITSHRLKLTGKPDEVYKLADQVVPLEVKPRPSGGYSPRERDVGQLLTYCVLLEDVWGATVTHGILQYDDARFTIPYGPEERRRVIELAEDIRRDRMAGNVPRNHREAWKCGRCGYSETCGQALR